MKLKTPIGITGVWLRTTNGEAEPVQIELLVEIDGHWHLVQTHLAVAQRGNGPISHITEAAGIARSPQLVMPTSAAEAQR